MYTALETEKRTLTTESAESATALEASKTEIAALKQQLEDQKAHSASEIQAQDPEIAALKALLTATTPAPTSAGQMVSTSSRAYRELAATARKFTQANGSSIKNIGRAKAAEQEVVDVKARLGGRIRELEAALEAERKKNGGVAGGM